MMKDDIRDSGTFTVETGAQWANVSRPTFSEWMKRADFPAFKSGRRWIIPREALIRWLNERAKERAQL